MPMGRTPVAKHYRIKKLNSHGPLKHLNNKNKNYLLLRPVSMGFYQSFIGINYADVAPY
jgi:hypothetical protein